MMRSLLCTPEFLQGEDTTHNPFWISAFNFLDAYITEVKEREDGRQLIKDLFCDFQSYVPQCPSEYSADPTQFLSYLSKLLYESDFTVSSTRYLDTQHFDRVASIHELYANFCQVSPRFALSMAEQYPLFPSSLYYSGKSLESASFFLHFFRYQTVLTPIMIENRLSCLTATFSKDQQSLILDSQHRTMSRIHAAQIDILRTFLTASPHSRDYVLNLTAMLCEANRARRSNPNDFLSSDGLLMNLLMAILALLAPVLDESPRHPTAKKWLLYFFSDLGRVDILQRNLPTQPDAYYAITSLLNWLRPANQIARDPDPKQWWILFRSRVEDLAILPDSEKSKPSAPLLSFYRDLRSLALAPTLSPAVLRLKPLYDYTLNFALAGRRLSPLTPRFAPPLRCARCTQAITTPSLFRCLCCAAYFLCPACFQKEVAEVCAAFTPPFPVSTLQLFAQIRDTGEMDQSHHALTHFFAQIPAKIPAQAYGRLFRPVPSFPPRLPDAITTCSEFRDFQKRNSAAATIHIDNINDNINDNNDDNIDNNDNNEDDVVNLDYDFFNENNNNNEDNDKADAEFTAWIAQKVEQIRGNRRDSAYVRVDGEWDAELAPYKHSICFCGSPRECLLHGPLSRAFRRSRNRGKGEFHGFLHPETACYMCGTSPIIGTVFHCMHCSLSLCSVCYAEEMEIGGGFPAHQCNHVFVLITHPVARHCFLAHNRHDMRCVPHTTQLIENASCMTGCILDQFIANDAYIDCNADNLRVELFALAIKLMSIGTAGFFQNFQLMDEMTRLTFSRQLRQAQLAVGLLPAVFLRFSEHLSFALLSLLNLAIPANCLFPMQLHLTFYCEDFCFIPDSAIPPPRGDSRSLLRDVVIIGVMKCPMFDTLASSLLELVSLTLEWLVRTQPAEEMRGWIERGESDYSLLLCALCLNPQLLDNLSQRFDLIQMFYCFRGAARDREDAAASSMLYCYPVLRHMLWLFAQQAFIDSASFVDPARASLVQLQTVKLFASLLRSRYVPFCLNKVDSREAMPDWRSCPSCCTRCACRRGCRGSSWRT